MGIFIILFQVIFLFVTIVLFVLAFWFTNFASISYLILIGLFELHVLYSHVYIKFMNFDFTSSNIKFTEEEKLIVKKYYIFFTYPNMAKISSRVMSGISLFTFLWLPLLLYKQCFIQGILLGINYYVARYFSKTLNPEFFLNRFVNFCRINKYNKEMLIVNSIRRKIVNDNIRTNLKNYHEFKGKNI
jgi:hypothetical protein